MTSAPAIVRYFACLLVSIVSTACSPPRDAAAISAVDLIRQFDRAEKRPAAAFDVAAREIGGRTHAAIVAPVPSRMVWPLSFPRRAVLRTFVAAEPRSGETSRSSVRLRIGVSDHRIYEGLAEAIVCPGEAWRELRVDLSDYAGWQWSLFYRPDRVTWRLVLAADMTGPAPASVLWGTPEVLTDTEAARAFAARR